ncbi:lycopene cyclase family protein [Streptomyces griseus]|uniref:lycopene cyclase family protein n=1 Tax=Streptomyces griseus TaxID=1911 RepID=UPI0004C74AAF|nr:lycopene cyclase family protein [Streptomyces griseus]
MRRDVAIIGAGAAGLSLAWRLLCPPRGAAAPSVVLVDAPPGPLRPLPRTWCYWERGPGEYDPWLTASWRRVRLHGTDGHPVPCDLGALRYKMLTSPVPLPPGRVRLLQHFKGWFLRSRRPVFTPGTVDLMDFRTPQPPQGLSFGYVLPLSRHEALVEYTEFSREPLPDEAYDRALRHYTGSLLGIGGFEVRGVERGRIPMTDARYERRAGPSTFRVGAAGGAVRPSTGYAFAAIQRQTRAVAALLHAGREPLPPPAYPGRSLLMDAILLRGIDTGRVSGPEFFTRLFEEVPPERLLRFLDGETRPSEEFRIGLRTPVLPMLRATAELPFLARRA